MLQKSRKGIITSRLVKVNIILIPNPDKEQNEKKIFLSEENLKDLLENIKYNNIHIIEVSEGRENALEKIFKEIVTENVPNLG